MVYRPLAPAVSVFIATRFIIKPEAALPEAFHTVPLLTCNSPALPQSVHQTISPVAGLAMASLWACVIRGGNKPLVVLVTSNSAEAWGVVVPIPTWEKTLLLKAIANTVRVIICLIFIS